MSRDRLKRLYDLHSWTGVLMGLFIFVVCFSGVTATFRHHLDRWEDPARQRAVESVTGNVHEVLTRRVEELGQTGNIVFLGVGYPTEKEPYITTRIRVADPETSAAETLVERWDADTGEKLPERGLGATHWLFAFHTHLMLPSPFGSYLVGIAGLLLLLSVVTGLLTHRKMIREAFTWRLDRSVRLKWQDSHKAMGLWLAPFHAMIALTGALLGLAGLLLIAVGLLAFDGDTNTLRSEMVAAAGIPAPAGIEAEMISLDNAFEIATKEAGVQPVAVNIFAWGDQNALYRTLFAPDKALSLYGNVDISGATGEVVRFSQTMQDGSGGVALNMATALHFGSYGGLALLVLYGLMGTALCVVTATGLMMWIERRRHGAEGGRPDWVYNALSRVVVGLCCGQVLASAAILPVDQFLAVAPEARLGVIGWTFFLVWGTAIAYALVRRQEYGATRELLAVAGLALIAAPLAVATTNGLPVINPLDPNHGPAAAFGWGIAVTGLFVLLVAWRLPKQRPSSFQQKAAHAHVSAQ